MFDKEKLKILIFGALKVFYVYLPIIEQLKVLNKTSSAKHFKFTRFDCSSFV